jgi:hypothetical protein
MNGRTTDRALAYAAHGWPVFPCRPGSKQPATRHGFQDATTDPGKISWWWKRDPAANVAIATGAPGPDVLDVDQHGTAGSGYPALSRLKTAGLLDTAGAIVKTPSGGLHVYFNGSDQPNGRLPRRHLDLRARGGYVLAPPSAVGGKPYQLQQDAPASGGLDWSEAVRLLEPSRAAAGHHADHSAGDLSRLIAWTAALGPESHNRNDGLFWAACRVAEAGNEAVLAELAVAARATGLGDREIHRTIESARQAAERRHCQRQGGLEGAP